MTGETSQAGCILYDFKTFLAGRGEQMIEGTFCLSEILCTDKIQNVWYF